MGSKHICGCAFAQHSALWGMRPFYSAMSLVVPLPLRWAWLHGVPANRQREGQALTFSDVCANSGPTSEKNSSNGVCVRVIPSASGVTVYNRWGVVCLVFLQVTRERSWGSLLSVGCGCMVFLTNHF